MRKKKMKQLLSLLLSCLLVLNVPMSALGGEEIQITEAGITEEAQEPGTQMTEVQEADAQILDEPAGMPEDPQSGSEEDSAGTEDGFLMDMEVMPEDEAAPPPKSAGK